MYPQSHFLFPLFIGELLVKLGYVDQRFVIVAVIVGVLIDLDHSLHHFVMTGEISVMKTADDAFKKHIDDRTFIHHKNGMLIITILFIIISKYASYWAAAVMIGYYSHMLLDHITADGRLLDKRTNKDYLGKTKPILFCLWGYTVKIAKFEIIFDLLMIVGLLIVYVA
ncbi:metal-dependent hydrolase [Candidatus Woesearchaeota archaeon]|nr:metal-dependent hydrolase [Candidatus Woesearchaeota archaeon]